MSALSFDPFLPEVLADPYPHYRRLRDATPALRTSSHGYDFFAVGRYADVCAVTKNTKVFSSTGGVGPAWAHHPMMSMADPPVDHGRLRKVVATFFTPAALKSLGERIEANMRERLDTALAKGRFDGYRDIGLPISLDTLTTLLGLPRDRDDDIERWTVATTDDLAGGLTPERQAEALRELGEFTTYLHGLVGERRASGAYDGLFRQILDTNDRGGLSKRELYAMFVLIIAAGYGTTATGIANTLLALASHPEQWRILQQRPELVPRAVEEALRWDGPIQSFFRNTIEDTTLGDVAVPKGSKVQVLFASANRDERKFPNPDTFDIERSVEGSVAFGHGVHFCLGGPLARIAIAAILRVLLAETRTLALDGPVERADNVLMRQYVHLPLAIERK